MDNLRSPRVEEDAQRLADAARRVEAVRAIHASELRALVSRFEAPELEALHTDLRVLRERVGRGEPVGPLVSPAEAEAFIMVLRNHPFQGTSAAIEVGLDLRSDPSRDRLSEIDALRRDVGTVLAVGLTVLASRGFQRRDVEDLLRVVFGADDASAALRDIILGRRPLGPGLPPIPPEILEIGERLERACVSGVKRAMLAYGRAAASIRVTDYTERIFGLSPDRGCGGETVRIQGTGFGATQPQGVQILFPRYGDGWSPAVVSSWSDTEIQVVAPADVGWGCIGAFQVEVLGEEAANLGEAASTLAGEIEHCFGPAVSQIADRIRQNLSHPPIPFPKCTGRNLFRGGKPKILSFTANEKEDLTISPGSSLTLAWNVRNAVRIEITIVPLGSTPHELQPISGNLTPTQGSRQLPPVGTATSAEWDAAYELRAWNDCTPDDQPVRQSVMIRMRRIVGLALSGGGAKGDFEVGAVAYLYDIGIRPRVIAGTSVGAINAAKLAEGDDPPTASNPRTAVQRLAAIWRSLDWNGDMYDRQPWVDQLANNDLKRLFLEGTWRVGPEGWALLALNPMAFLAYVGVDAVLDYNDLKDALDKMRTAPSIYHLGPIEARLRDRTQFDPSRVASSGILLRLVVVGLESGRAKVVTERGELLGPLGGLATREATVGLVEAILASAAIPIVFPPVKLGSENFVDGGVREILPLRAVIREDVAEVFAIHASPQLGPATHAFDAPKPHGVLLADIGVRSLEMMLDEIAADDGEPFNGWGPNITVKIIRPSFEVHDALTIDPGLIDINMGYGYMRAGDVLAVSDSYSRSRAIALSDLITRLRKECWELEFSANGVSPPRARGVLSPNVYRPSSELRPVPDPYALDAIRQRKKQIRDAVQERRQIGAPVPPGVESWWQQWERHQSTFRFYTGSPWEFFSSTLGTRPSESPPPA